jgi:hypothetical protein
LPNSRLFSRVSASAFITLFFASLAFGQITNVPNDTSTPIPGAGHNYIKMLNETANPSNGSVSKRICLPVPPGRGLTIPFCFAYDSNGTRHLEDLSGGEAGWATNLSYLGKGGWSYAVPQLNDTLITVNELNAQGHNVPCPVNSGYVFDDAGGGRHSFSLDVSQLGTSPCNRVTSHSQATDYIFQASTTAPGLAPPVTVVSPSGTVYHFSDPGQATGDGYTETYAGLPDFVEDRNGNKILITDSTNGVFNYSDTLGRTVISFSGFGENGNPVTVSGPSNLYTLTWGTASSSFPAPGYTATSPDTYCTPPLGSSETDPVTKTCLTGPPGLSAHGRDARATATDAAFPLYKCALKKNGPEGELRAVLRLG